jgi:hypothetical protein
MTGDLPKPTPAGLSAKTSVKGSQYLTGRLGGLKVLVMENRDRKSDDDPSHTLFFVEAPDRRQEPQERAQERSGGAGSAPDRPEAPTASPQRLPGAWAAGCRSSGTARCRSR